MNEIELRLQEADTLVRAGQFEPAATIYRQVLERLPGSGEVHFLLGCLYIRAGTPFDALSPLREAVRLLPDLAEPTIVLGNALIALKQWDEAVRALAQAVAISPQFMPAQLNRALALASAGRSTEAEDLYRKILASEPNSSDAHRGIALVFNEQQRFSDAEPHARIAVDLTLDNAASFEVLGNSLYGLGRMGEAVAAYQRSVELDPTSLKSLLHLFQVLRTQGRYEEAARTALRAANRFPGDPSAVDAVGLALIDLDRLDDAISHYSRAILDHPDSESMVRHLALACGKNGKFEEAVRYGTAAVALKPTMVTRCSLALDQLRTGRYAEAWANYEERAPAWLVTHHYGIPKWDGSPLSTGPLYIYAEGGLGDTILHARFVPLVAERAQVPVLFACQPELVDLLGDLPGVSKFLPQPAGPLPPPEPCEAHISLLSLPALFQSTEDTLPSPLLPLRASEDAEVGWRSRLARLAGMKIGLRWAGNPSFQDDNLRSLALAVLAPLGSVQGVSFVSLQPEATGEAIASSGLSLLHWPEGLADWTKTTALLRQLDLVISTCTSVPHLAGAMGLETWLLLPFVPNWCWNAYRPHDTAWYPTHRLFRQPRIGDWQSVIEHITRELEACVAGNRAATGTETVTRVERT